MSDKQVSTAVGYKVFSETHFRQSVGSKTTLTIFVWWLWINVGSAELADHYGPQASAVMQSKEAASESLFGYSLMVRDGLQPEMVVGAPRAGQIANPALNHSGALYHCLLPTTLKTRLSNDTQRVQCEQIHLDKESSRIRGVNEYKDDMWLGASIVGNNRVNGRIIACAPRWVNLQQLNKEVSRQLVNGMCYDLLASNLTADLKLLLPTVDQEKQAFPTDRGFHPLAQYAEAGLVAHLSEDGRNLLLGAPGYAGWIGSVVHYDISETPDKLDYFTLLHLPNTFCSEPSTVANYGYFGYSVTSGVFTHNGETMYAASAPRADVSQETEIVPSVLVFDFPPTDEGKLTVRASLPSPQVGSYFGAALLALDANADGRPDLLVGAPLYADPATRTVEAGRVYLYLNTQKADGQLELISNGEADGQRVSGARFGHSLASLGDIDGDTFPEFAAGAPYEGSGVVYLYSARSMRLLQRIIPAGDATRGFGIALARAPDLDRNGCDELAVGSLGSAAVLRCRPTLEVRARIHITGYDRVQFCVDLPNSQLFSTAQIDISVEASVPAGEQRVSVTEARFEIRARPGERYCNERQLIVEARADLTRPVELTMNVVRVPDQDAAHALLAHRSLLTTTQRIILKISHPELDLQLIPLSNILFELGTMRTWSGVLIVRNTGESAYGARVRLAVDGARVLRVPPACKIPAPDIDTDNLHCDLITPLHNGQETQLPFELDVSELRSDATAISISASALDELTARSAKLVISLLSRAVFNLTGWSTPEQALQQPGMAVALLHHFQVINEGPTHWRRVEVRMRVSNAVRILRSPCNGSAADEVYKADGAPVDGLQRCLIYNMSVDARSEFTIALETDHLVLDKLLNNLEEVEIITTAEVIPERGNGTRSETSTLILRAQGVPLWVPFAALVPALLLLALLIYLLQRNGFFRRKERDELEKLRGQEQVNTTNEEIVTEEIQYTPYD